MSRKKEDVLRLLGQRIKKLRSEKGWTQAELARACFKDRQSIERLENGKINPSVYYMTQIAEGLDVPLKIIFDFKVREL